uniref:Uncharacterized protein n=1 Tax=Panagrolaimus sp. ES5 TaxID=591445 RepID=A0AC34FMU4_9BILA
MFEMSLNDYLLSEKKHYQSCFDAIDNRFNNLNLNGNTKCILVDDVAVSYDNKKAFGYEKEDELTKKAVGTTSTLSLHIACYEKSGEVDTAVSECENGISKKKDGLIKAFKRVFSPTPVLNPFEFPRQQGNLSSLPEVMQFKASQGLLNPNASTPTSSNDQYPNEGTAENAASTNNQQHQQLPPNTEGQQPDPNASAASIIDEEQPSTSTAGGQDDIGDNDGELGVFTGEQGWSRKQQKSIIYCATSDGHYGMNVKTYGNKKTKRAVCRECEKLCDSERKKKGQKFQLKYFDINGLYFLNDDPRLSINHHADCTPITTEKKIKEQCLNKLFRDMRAAATDEPQNPESLYLKYRDVMEPNTELDDKKARKYQESRGTGSSEASSSSHQQHVFNSTAASQELGKRRGGEEDRGPDPKRTRTVSSSPCDAEQTSPTPVRQGIYFNITNFEHII